MILKDLLRQLDYEVIQGDENIEINKLQNDSRKVGDRLSYVTLQLIAA